MKFYIVDCFAEQKYQGNQLAVFIPDRDLSREEMQQIAQEIGFSETTFVLSDKQVNGGYDVRIFTPGVEVPFAGHPTLGTAHIIRNIIEDGAADKVLLNLAVGQIPVFAEGETLIMSQNEPEFGEILGKEAVAAGVSIQPEDIRDDYPVQWVSTGLEAVIVPVKDVEVIKKSHVNHDKLDAFHKAHYKCNVLLFAEESDGLRVRVFMDDPGFLEDPATGSANGDLAGYLLKHNFFGRHNIAYTVSQGREMGRPSKLHIQADCTDGKYTILVGGQAYVVAEGDWK